MGKDCPMHASRLVDNRTGQTDNIYLFIYLFKEKVKNKHIKTEKENKNDNKM